MMGALDCVSTSNVDKLTNSNDSLQPQGRAQHVITESRTERCPYLWWGLLLDLPLLLLFSAVLLVFSGHFVIVFNHQAGFFCNDPALSYPFHGDTVSAGVLLSSVTLGPLIVMLLIESIKNQKNSFPFSACIRARHTLIETIKVYRTYLFGFIMNLTFVMIVKCFMGRPRPNFFDACQPDTAKTCNGTEFVSSFECTSQYGFNIQHDSYQSFPSGHTSLSVYTGFFTALYLQYRAHNPRNKSALIVPTLQFLCIMFSTICSFTRITDHRHHWWDVAVGAFVGFVDVYFVVTMQLDKFKVMKRPRIVYNLPTYDNTNISNMTHRLSINCTDSTDNAYINNEYSIKM